MKMWSDLQNSGVSGCGKRRAVSPCDGGGKAARWEDSIARLEAVAAGAGDWDEERRACRRRWCGPHDTIRAENGKSYLELGSAPPRPCCDLRATGRCASRRCYRERRARVMNLCAFKLARFRQTADPSLRRSVLVCNTLRSIEREMERESAEDEPPVREYPMPAATVRDPASGRATPFPVPPQPSDDSGYGESERSIDWGSVLSLSSRSALDPTEDAWTDDWSWSEDGFARLLVGTS